MRRVWIWCVALMFGLVWAGLVQAAKVEFHGQFGAKLQTTNSWGMLSDDPFGAGTITTTTDEQNGNDLDDTWASLQFRLWATAASDDGKVKGTWAMEVGSVNFGGNGLGLHNNEANIESRIMSLEFALPFGQSMGLRLRAGLNPYFVNRFLWNETAPGIDLMGKTTLGNVDTTFVFVWVRAADNVNSSALSSLSNNDWDAFAGVFIFDLAKALNVDKAVAKVYFIPMNNNTVNPNHTPWFLGGDAQFKVAGVEVDAGVIHVGGDAGRDINNKSVDYDGWLTYADLGYELNEQAKVSFLWWWASGDDKPNQGDVENYWAVDTHTEGSVVLFEDGAFDDGYVVSRHPYLNNLGFQMYRLRLDYKATPKLSLAAAVNYMKFDEDAEWGTHKEDEIGWELDLYAKYEMYPGLTVDLAAGYLWAGDALDAWADKNGDGAADSSADDMYRVSLGVTYTF